MDIFQSVLINNSISFNQDDSLEKLIRFNYKKINLESLLIDPNCHDYKCFEILKELIKDDNFKETLIEGYINDEIRPFKSNLWEVLDLVKYRDCDNLSEAFKRGLNIGNCTNFAKEMGIVFEDSEICFGEVPLLEGTFNCPEGDHTWISIGGEIYDTSLMIIMTEDFSKRLGYQEIFRCKIDDINYYEAKREYAKKDMPKLTLKK